jgi:NTE family protein
MDISGVISMRGIAFEGGGARGAYQVGVWKAFDELGMQFDGITGTSVGAINGALMIQGDLDKALTMWSEIDPAQIFASENIQEEKPGLLDRLPGNLAGFMRIFHSSIQSKGIDITPLKELLHEHISEERIRASGKDFGLVTVSVSDMTPKEVFLDEIPPGQLVDYIIASSSLPVFQSQRVEGKRYLDGAFYDRLPINMLLKKGYDEVIAVSIGGLGVRRRTRKTKAAITYIEPAESLGNVLEFDTERIRYNIQLGYYDTLRVMKGYRGQQYYVDLSLPDDYFVSLYSRLPEAAYLPLLTALRFPDGGATRRSLFEHLIPRVAKILKLTSEATYGDIQVALLEWAAMQLELPRFQIYTYSTLRDTILHSKVLVDHPSKSRLVRYLKKSDLLPRAKKDDILRQFLSMMLKTEDALTTETSEIGRQ